MNIKTSSLSIYFLSPDVFRGVEDLLELIKEKK